MTPRRYDAQWVRTAIRTATLVLLGVVASWSGATAQIGHDPARSPYHDIPHGGVGLATFGYLGGSRGRVGVGVSDGPTFGLRYEVAPGAIGVSLGVAYAQTTRFVVDPAKDSASRKTGPFDTDVILVDAGLQLVLTGRKTWHGFAPYLGGAMGVAVGGGSPPDPSGYDFGNKFTFAPEAGVRWYPGRRVSVRADFRAVAWKLTYPISYKVPASDGTRVLPLDATLNEWTWHPWLTIGLGWTF